LHALALLHDLREVGLEPVEERHDLMVPALATSVTKAQVRPQGYEISPA
jgi:hypothetical protein